jgi:signal transduction histidine kinase
VNNFPRFDPRKPFLDPGHLTEFTGISKKQTEIIIPPGGGRSLSIRFAAGTFAAPDRPGFRYRMADRDASWTDTGSQRFVELEDLPPGHYRFQVTAANCYGVWNTVPAEIDFYLAPFFYQTWSFYGFCGLVFASAFGGLQGYRARLNRRITRLEQEAALGRERSRIARDLHDDIGASLTQIAMASELARAHLAEGDAGEKDIEKEIEKLSRLARGAVENMSQIIWSTNPKFDTLAGLTAYMREYAAKSFPDSVEVRFEAPDWEEIHVSSEFRGNLFYFVKEALANALKHSSASLVFIQLAGDSAIFQMSITDNGKGFTKNERMLTSTGLDSMKKRALDLHGECEIVSEPGRGTAIRISVPLREHILRPAGSAKR